MKRLIALVLAITIFLPSVAIAQTPTADEDDGVFTTIRKRAGIEITGEATAAYQLAGISFTDPLVFLFWVTEFKSDDDAERMMELVREEFPRDYVERFTPDADAPPIIATSSDPPLDYDQITYAGSMIVDGFTRYDAILFTRVGSMILVASGAALMGNMVATMAPYINLMVERVGDFDASRQELSAILPTLDDLPPGYVATEDD